MWNRVSPWLVLCALLASPAAMSAHARQFVHGYWFDVRGFARASFYAVDGVLVTERPRGPVETVDLMGGYVIPPLADAHNHLPSSRENFSESNRLLLGSGVYYVLNPNEVAERSNLIRAELGTPYSVDVAFAHAGFTCSGGHPTRLYQQLVDQKIYPYTRSELEGRAFYSIDSLADIEQKWPQFLATKPDFVKIYLLHSEMYREPNRRFAQPGMRPEFVAELTRRAHAVGLRVGAHVESAEDFHHAIVGGVDFVMHLPGYWWLPGDTGTEYLLSEADIGLARLRNVTVVTTIDLADTQRGNLAQIRGIQAENLRRLKRAGVTIVVGTDTDPGNIASEVEDLQATAVFSNAELLRMLVETTARSIFPHRKIGRLRAGYEANFLVLRSNPLRSVEALKAVSMRIKHGELQ